MKRLFLVLCALLLAVVALGQPSPGITQGAGDRRYLRGVGPSILKASLQGVRTKMSVRESQGGLLAGNELTLAELSGSGSIRSIWMATTGQPFARDSRLRVYYGLSSTTPAVDVDIATLYCAQFYAELTGSDPGRKINTENLTFGSGVGGADGSFGFTCRYPIAFQNGVRVTLYNASSGAPTAGVFSLVEYTSEVTSSLELRSTCVPATSLSATTIANTDDALFLNLGSGSGWIAYHGVLGQGLTNSTWLERNVQIKDGLDGLVWRTLSSGWEDVIRQAWYMWSQEYNDYRFAFVTYFKYNYAYFGMDWLAYNGGERFVNGVQYRAAGYNTDSKVASGHKQAYCVLYYVENAPAPTNTNYTAASVLPAGVTAVAEYEFSNRWSVRQDSTTDSTHNILSLPTQICGWVPDKTGNGHDLKVYGSGDTWRPTITASIFGGSVQGLLTDGSNDKLQMASGITLTGDFAIFFGGALSTNTSDHYTILGNDSGNYQVRLNQGGADSKVMSLYANGSPAAVSSAGPTTVTAPAVWAWVRRGSTAYFYRNGTLISSASVSTNSMVLNNLGSFSGTVQPAAKYGHILVASGTATDANVLTISASIKAQLGI